MKKDSKFDKEKQKPPDEEPRGGFWTYGFKLGARIFPFVLIPEGRFDHGLLGRTLET